MSIPAAITTATVHHDAPISFGGEPGRVMARFTPSATLIWEDTGTPLAGFFDAVSPENGAPLEIELPHTDQPGFIDGAGNTLENWHYSVKIWFFKDGQNISFPSRDFQLSSGQSSVDLALIPWGEAVDPTVAPLAYVTSVNGQTGDLEIESLQGPAGATGPQGPAGPTGATGAQGPAGPIVPLDTLTDVVAPAPSDGQALIWDAGTSKWVNRTVSTANIALDSLTDVTAPSPSNGHVLTWDNATSQWKNAAPVTGASSLATLTDAAITSPSNSQVLTYDIGSSKWKNTAVPSGPSPSVRASSSNAGATGNPTITVPGTAVAGDVLVIFVGSNYSMTGSAPAGWTNVASTNGGWHNVVVLAKVCVAGDIGSTVTVTLSGSEPWDAYCLAIKDTDGLANVTAVQTPSSVATLASPTISGWTQRDTLFVFGSARTINGTLTFPAPTSLVIARPATENLVSAVYQASAPAPQVTPGQTVSYLATAAGAGTPTGFGTIALRAVALGTQGAAYVNSITDTVGPYTTPSFKVSTNVHTTTNDPMVWLDSSAVPNNQRLPLRITQGNVSGDVLQAGIWFSNFFYKRFAIGNNGSINRLSEFDYSMAIGNANAQDLLPAGFWGSVFTTDRSLQWVKRNNTNGTWPSWNVQPIGFYGSPITQTANYTVDCRDTVIVGNGTSITFTLPDPTTAGLSGREFKIKNKHSTALTVVSAGTTKTIDGSASIVLNQWDKMTVITDGTDWLIIEGRKAVTVSTTAPTAPIAGDVWFDIS